MPLLFAGLSYGSPRLPLSDTAFDSGVISAESLGRGGTVASNRGTAASGSENPASLVEIVPSFYTTTFVGETADLPERQTEIFDPLQNKVLQYFAIAGERGILFYEPLGRIDRETIVNANHTQTVDFSATAIGLGGAQKFGNDGSIGLSLAYLRANFTQIDRRFGLPDQTTTDSGDGVRLNLGIRYPTGPTMWGFSIQNAPGFLWWQHHRRQLLPVRIRLGNTWRVQPGTLFSIEGEQRYYREGGNKEDFIRAGFEARLGERAWLRTGGIFTNDVDDSDKHHYTAGLTLVSMGGIHATYALERFEINQEKVIKSYVSVTLPFATEAIDEK